jgi:hypothetical protein
VRDVGVLMGNVTVSSAASAMPVPPPQVAVAQCNCVCNRFGGMNVKRRIIPGSQAAGYLRGSERVSAGTLVRRGAVAGAENHVCKNKLIISRRC